MKIGIIGAGTVAQTIARHVLPFGHQVMLSNTQGPDSLTPLVKKLGPGAIAGTAQQAAEHDIVILAVMWWNVRRPCSRFPTGSFLP
jgi:predicted dinucleotide-binding enzyme